MNDWHKNEQVLVVIPSYNEGKVIRQTLLNVLAWGYAVVLVDDGSVDDTYEQVKDLDIHYLKHTVNLGQGAALQTGMTFALRAGYAYVVHFDADGQHSAADIGTLIHPLISGEVDIVLGSRFIQQSSQQRVPWQKRILLKSAIIFQGLLTGLWLSDAHNGLRAMNRKGLERIRLMEQGMSHATEILMEIKKHLLTVKEVPVHIEYHAYSQAKGQSMWNAMNIVADILLRKIFS